MPEIPTLSAEDREQAEKSLRHYLTLTGHLYRSDGDPRFLERMLASQQVTDDLMADIVYLRRNGRYQEPTMQGLEIVEVQLASPGKVEVQTLEYWVIRTRSLADGAETDPVRSDVLRARYLMSKENTGWIVQMWELVADKEQGPAELTNENHELNAEAQRRRDAKVLGQ